MVTVGTPRTPTLDDRDLKTAIGARYTLPKGTPFHVSHRPGRAEPLLWIADVVAGAVRLAREGGARAQHLFAENLLAVSVDTGC